MPASLKLNAPKTKAAVKFDFSKPKPTIANVTSAASVQRRNRLRILELAGKITFAPDWDYKKMRGKR